MGDLPMNVARPRPFALFVILLAAFFCASLTRADDSADAAKTAAVSAMEAWLGRIDTGDYAASWHAASPAFQKAVSQSQWTAALDSARKPAGACRSRKLASAMRQEGVPQPDGKMLAGDFVIAQFHTAFANLASATETVTFERGPDGTWRASGYYIRPGQ